MRNFIEAVEKSIENKNWYSALGLALALPDICGKIQHSNLSSSKRYIKWFDEYVLFKYISNVCGESQIFLCGSDCYALRCSYLHQGESTIEEQRAREVLSKFVFTAPNEEMLIHNNFTHCGTNVKLQLQVDIFCKDIADGVKKWLEEHESNYKNELEKLIRINDRPLKF